MKIVGLEVLDLRFPTSRTLDGTDAVHLDPDYCLGSERVRAEFALPIRLQGRLLGILDMQSTTTASFSRYSLQTLVGSRRSPSWK